MIQPVTYQGKLEGKSNAHLITFSDGKDYVVKFMQQGFEKSLANEWVAYCLGRYLGLPVPFAKIIEIPQGFSASIPELTESQQQTQYQFASLYIPGCMDGHQAAENPQIANSSVLAGIIVFDYWLYNSDRTRKNILLREETPDSFRLWIIDHAEILGSYNWALSDLENLPADGLIKSATHELMAANIENGAEFHHCLELIQTIPILLIEEIVEVIPDEWAVTKEEKKAIVSALLLRRKKILPELISKFIKKVYQPLREEEG